MLCVCVRSVTQATATYLYLMAMGITEPPSSNACSGSEVCQDGVCAVYVPPTVWTAAMCVCKRAAVMTYATLEHHAVLVVDARALREDQQRILLRVFDVLLDAARVSEHRAGGTAAVPARHGEAVLLLVALEPQAAEAAEDVVLQEAHGTDVLLADDGEGLRLQCDLVRATRSVRDEPDLLKDDDVDQGGVVGYIDLIWCALRRHAVVPYDARPGGDEGGGEETHKIALSRE